MPTSYLENVPSIMRWIEQHRPSSVFDVGVGYGKYGFLIRERLDNFNRDIRIEGCEIFPSYAQRSVVAYVYDDIYLADFLNPVVPKIDPYENPYDLVLMIDVLEHFSEEDGLEALGKALTIGKTALVSTPLGYPQGEVYGNKHEAHLSEWPHEKLMSYAALLGCTYERIWGGTEDSVIAALARA